MQVGRPIISFQFISPAPENQAGVGGWLGPVADVNCAGATAAVAVPAVLSLPQQVNKAATPRCVAFDLAHILFPFL